MAPLFQVVVVLSEMNLVVGLGPVGSIVAAHLTQAGHDVVGVDVSVSRLADVSRQGIEITGICELSARLRGVAGSISDAVANGPYDRIFLCVKATDLSAIGSDLAPVLGPRTTLVLMQNGLGIEAPLVGVAPSDRFVRVVVNFAGQLQATGKVGMTFFHPPNFAGIIGFDGDAKPDPAAIDIAAVLTSAGLVTDAVVDLERRVWHKVIHLAILAPLCAITRLDMRSALAQREVRKLAQGLLNECILVADKLGYTADDGFFERSMHYVLTAGDHPPSMLVDILNGRPTEVDFINKKVVEIGVGLGLDLPLNSCISGLVMAIESKTLQPLVKDNG